MGIQEVENHIGTTPNISATSTKDACKLFYGLITPTFTQKTLIAHNLIII